MPDGRSPEAAGEPAEAVRVVSTDAALARLATEKPLALATDPLAPFRLPAPAHACDDGATAWADAVEEVATSLARRRIPYRSGPLADCSGMAHRVLRELGARCESVERPPVRVARRARELARWYEAEGRLARVHALADIDAHLEVGALAFFLAPGRRSGGLDKIFHVGTVVEVERDAEGRVQRYALFHGRRPGKVASITRWHTRDHAVPLGNGRERLVALGFPGGARALEAVEEAAVADDGLEQGVADHGGWL